MFLFLILRSGFLFPGLRPINLEIPLHCTLPNNLTSSPVQYIRYSSFYVCVLTMPLAFLLIHIDKKGVTRCQFNFLLPKAIQFHSIQGHFRPHSFRIGRATDLAKRGVPDSEIIVLGMWDSKAFQNYIRL